MKKESKFAAKGVEYRYSDLQQRCTEHVKRFGSPDNEACAAHRERMEREVPLDNRVSGAISDDRD